MKNRNLEPDDNWLTPLSLYEELNNEFSFDFDPCPYNESIITTISDGLNLKNKWGKSNFINPPYSRKLKEAFVLRAIDETYFGNMCVCLLPVSTSTKLFHNYILPNAFEIRYLKGRVRFQKYNAEGNRYTPKNGNGMHDSMIVIFK